MPVAVESDAEESDEDDLDSTVANRRFKLNIAGRARARFDLADYRFESWRDAKMGTVHQPYPPSKFLPDRSIDRILTAAMAGLISGGDSVNSVLNRAKVPLHQIFNAE